MNTNLPFDCSYTEIWVSPPNWKTISEKKGMAADWYVQCIFHDPQFIKKYPKGFPFRKRLNRLRTVGLRQKAVALYLQEIPRLFEEKGYNPITKTFMIEPVLEPEQEPKHLTELLPETPFDLALNLALSKMRKSNSTMADLKYLIQHLIDGIRKLRMNDKPIYEVKRRDIKTVIEFLEKEQGEFSPHKYNKYLTYLSIIWSELKEWDAVDTNIIRDIKKRTTVKKQRIVLNKDERKTIVDYMRLKCPEFYHFTQIFFHSGIRITELLSIKIQDVDLENQKFRYLLKKGGQYTWKDGIIKDIALPYWRKVTFGGHKSDFVFSHGLIPGPVQLQYNAIRLRWSRNIKSKLGIKADFYSLKHLNLDETTQLLSLNDAAAMANHTTTEMVRNVYAVGEKERQQERLKKLANEL